MSSPAREKLQQAFEELGAVPYEKRELRQAVERLASWIKRRKPGGGRKRYFPSQDRIEELKEACREILRQKPTLRKRKNTDALMELMRLELNDEERDVSRDELLRQIIRSAKNKAQPGEIRALLFPPATPFCPQKFFCTIWLRQF